MDQSRDKRQTVGTPIPLIAIVAALFAITVIVGGAYLYRNLSAETAHRHIDIATGPESGTYYAMGNALQRVLESTGNFSSVRLRTTDGSAENMELIRATTGGVDLAFVQGDASPSTNARLITPLYDEALHILISTSDADTISTIYDFEGLRVSLGSAGSGTRELAQRVLTHFGITVGEDLVLTPRQASEALANESIDAAFMLTAIPSELISGLAERDQIRFISLGGREQTGDEAHALELVFPGVHRATIPRSTYVRLPRQAVHTIGVTALLVAREGLEDSLVRDVAKTVFSYRSGSSGLEGNALLVARRIRENYDPSSVTIPYHPGATAYYRREEPPFFAQYAEALSLGLTLMLALYSIFIAVREWLRRRMKNRVDRYLLEVERLATDIRTIDHRELLHRQDAMLDLRRAAFADLVSERLLADEAFTILQNHLRDEQSAIEARIAETSSEPQPEK